MGAKLSSAYSGNSQAQPVKNLLPDFTLAFRRNLRLILFSSIHSTAVD